MKSTALIFAAVIGVLAIAGRAYAAPMGYKNSWMIMGDFSKTYQEFSFN
jgi:hypothetical protein